MAATISIQSASVNLLIAAWLSLKDCLEGLFLLPVRVLRRQLPYAVEGKHGLCDKGCSVQSVPSWSNVAIRSAGATYFALVLVVTSLTKERMACLAGPLFHDGRGSRSACALVIRKQRCG